MSELADDPFEGIQCDKDGIGGEGDLATLERFFSLTMPPEQIRRGARRLRIAVIRSQFRIGNLTREEALELLRGPLTPGDDSTIVDDSGLLDSTWEQVIEAIK